MGVSKIFNILVRSLVPEFATSNCKEHSPSWEATSPSASQQILRVNIHCRVHKSPLPVTIPSYINPDDSFLPYAFKIHFNIILSFTPSSSDLPLSFRFPQGNSVCICLFPHTCIMLRQFHSYGINHPEIFPLYVRYITTVWRLIK